MQAAGQQLPLEIGLREEQDLEGFVAGDNAFALATVREMALGAGEQQVFLWGPAGAGKSHLLQGACLAASRRGEQTAHLPLARLADLGAGVLEGLEAMSLVCVDDVDAIAGRRVWEEGLFGLVNRVRDAGGRLIFAAGCPPGDLGIGLPDLVSRLGWGPVFRVAPLDDAHKLEALAQRARARGLELPAEVGSYLIRRYPRDPRALFDLLERLDTASMAAQRRLTVPFVKSVLES